MKKSARILNWVALIWTILGIIYSLTTPGLDIWTFLYFGVLVAAQVLALMILK